MGKYILTYTTSIEACVEVDADSLEEATQLLEDGEIEDLVRKSYDISVCNWDTQVLDSEEV